ncbi:MAG: tripartite tricarboxylate transporter permease [Candidatus Competibacterales bacterium]|nr:tripartite tricarboxylate transporter permease [Candidatus Competibacterales bacterium]
MELIGLLPELFTLGNLLAILAGVLGGLCIGALPGLTANLGVALLLPITFSMDVTAALLMLISLYTAAIYGGAFPAILLHTPGTSASAATAIDGFVLTQRGEADKAIRVVTLSSVVGGMVSGVALLVFAPPLSLLSLKFGPAEYFMLAVFGLTVIATLSTGNMIKGLISGAAGLLLSTVGMDINSGFPRYTFGFFELQSGINFVPAVIGLFSLSQALLMCEEAGRSIQRVEAAARGWRFLPTRAEIRQIRTTLARSSVIGVIVGILPGAGGDIGSWVSYNEAQRFARDKRQFGRGSIVGISASETANNAVTGSSLIPLLTLGIPGSTTAAILLGALVIHGLLPGRTLFEEHAHITYTVILGFMLANLVMGVAGMALGRYATRVTRLPNFVLVPVIIVLSVVGSYSLGNNFFDVYTMLAFGIVGYFMRKAGFHPAPMILGLILGPIAETGFRQSMTLADGPVIGYLLRSPISLTLFALTLISVVTAAWLEYRRVRSEKHNQNPDDSTPAH